MKNIYLVIGSLLVSSVALANHPIQVGQPVVEAALKAMSQGQLVIDVRQEACDSGVVKGAAVIPVDIFVETPKKAIAAVLKWNGGRKDTDIMVYCRSGARAAKAIDVLRQHGFMKLHNLGGLGDYVDEQNMQGCNR
jgi:rhodanese-related sulfurtransferase